MGWDVRGLRAFVAAADAGTFTDAAVELGVSQATLSRTVAAVENAFGVRLLRRLPRGCELTPAGQQILPYARRILAETTRLDEYLAVRTDALRLGYAWSALGKRTVDLYHLWAKRCPQIDLELIRCPTPTSGLAEGRVDVALVRRAVDPERFDSTVVGVEPRLVAFSTNDREWASTQSVTMHELTSRIIVTDPTIGDTPTDLWAAFEHTPVFFEIASGIEGWLDAIAAGRGVGLTAEATVHYHRRPGLSYLPVTDAPPVPVQLIWRKGEPPGPLRALVAMISELYL